MNSITRKLFLGLNLALILAMILATGAFASDVVASVVDTTAPTGSVTLAAGGSGTIVIDLTVTGKQEGTATFDVFRDWTLSGGSFTGSNPQEFTVPPRTAQDPATSFATTGSVIIRAGQPSGTFTLAVGAFDITNSNTTGAKLAAGTSSSYQVTVSTPTKLDATCTISGYTGTYDGVAHGASGTCTGAGGVDLSSGLNLGSTFINFPGGTAHWTFTGGNNYNDQSGDAAIVINQAPSTTLVSVSNATYDGSPHSASASVTGAGGLNQSLAVTYTGRNGTTYSASTTAPTDAGDYTASASYSGDINHTGSSDSQDFTISAASSATTVSVSNATYDGNPHGGTAGVTGAGGLNLSLVVTYRGRNTTAYGPSSTAPTNAGDYTASASYAGDANHTSSSDSKDFSITKANASCTISGYTGVYDGQAHGATGSCTGVGGVLDVLTGLNLGTSFIDYPGGTAHWTFAGGTNYNEQSGDVAITINKADASCNVSGYTGTYDAAAHGATGSCTGVGGTLDILTGLNLGATFTNYPGGTAHWTFTGGTNYNDKSGDAAIVINKASSTTVLTFESDPYVYRGNAFTATANVTGVGGLDQSVAIVYTGDCTNVTSTNGCTATATFAGDTNHFGSSDIKSITITPKPASITANDKTKTYGDDNPALTATVTGTVNEDTLDFTLSTTAEKFSSVGDYPITVTLGTNHNYNITKTDGNLHIEPRPITVTADVQTKILGALDPALTYTLTSSNLVNSDSFSGELSRVAGEGIGSYDILQGTLTAGSNYAMTFVGAKLSIVYAPAGYLCLGAPGHQILQPIDADGNSVFKQKSTVPAKFRVCDANGSSIGTPGVVSSFKLVQVITSTGGTVNEVVDSTTPDTSFRWSATDQQWIFNINTKNLFASNAYYYEITLNDGTKILFHFSLK